MFACGCDDCVGSCGKKSMTARCTFFTITDHAGCMPSVWTALSGGRVQPIAQPLRSTSITTTAAPSSSHGASALRYFLMQVECLYSFTMAPTRRVRVSHRNRSVCTSSRWWRLIGDAVGSGMRFRLFSQGRLDDAPSGHSNRLLLGSRYEILRCFIHRYW